MTRPNLRAAVLAWTGWLLVAGVVLALMAGAFIAVFGPLWQVLRWVVG